MISGDDHPEDEPSGSRSVFPPVSDVCEVALFIALTQALALDGDGDGDVPGPRRLAQYVVQANDDGFQ